METQKENMGLNAGSSSINQDKLSTPQRKFAIHEDSESTSKRSLKERSCDKRRALGDISNKQRDYQRNDNKSDGVMSGKKAGSDKTLEITKPLNLKKKKKTLQKAKAVASLEPKTEIKPPHVDKVPEIEVAYGGLSSPKPSSSYLKDLHDEIIQDIINDKTPTLFDEFDSAHVIDNWKQEKAMLESGELPSPWWLKKLGKKTDVQEKTEEQYSVFDDVPPPDDFSNDCLGSFDEDQLLEDILSLDVEAVCTA